MVVSDLSGIRYSLDVHGWTDWSIALSLDTLVQQLPTWRNLIQLGHPDEFEGRECQFPTKPLRIGTDSFYPILQMGPQLDKGSYGRIVSATRTLYLYRNRDMIQVSSGEIVCKVNEIMLDEEEAADPDAEEFYAEEIQAVLHEAVLHALAGEVMRLRGFPTVIPAMYEVFAYTGRDCIGKASDIESVVIGMEFVEGMTLHKYLHDEFPIAKTDRERAKNDRLLMDILLQLCIYLEILQRDLRFNHRDLKTNNLLRRTQPAGWYRSFQHPALSRPWIAFHDLVLIDFGFSCVSCKEDASSMVQAGGWFRQEHDCLKGGRDIALFLHCLQVYFPLQRRISERLWETLHAAACVEGVDGNPSLLDYGVKEDGTIEWTTAPTGYFIFGDGVYKLLRRSDVDVAGCSPTTLLATLDQLRSPVVHEKN